MGALDNALFLLLMVESETLSGCNRLDQSGSDDPRVSGRSKLHSDACFSVGAMGGCSVFAR